jgi:hypothetical protein
MNDTVVFMSEPLNFGLEQSGLKSNTVRQLSTAGDAEAIGAIKNMRVKKIRIINTVDRDAFERKVTSIAPIGSLLGNKLFVFSWKHED